MIRAIVKVLVSIAEYMTEPSMSWSTMITWLLLMYYVNEKKYIQAVVAVLILGAVFGALKAIIEQYYLG